jgi:hypothetical protein
MTRPAFLPTPQQELLLKAALFSGDDARSAFLEWAASADLDRLDSGSFRLLPALHLNLKALGVTHALTPRLLSVYRSTWYRNQLLLNQAASVIRMLADHEIDSVLLKGAALASGIYGDPGARPMADADLLVRRGDVRAAADLLRATGWNPWPPVSARTLDSFLGTKHAIGFRDGAGRELDLHRHVFFRNRVEALDDALWDRSQPATVGGVPARILAPEDLLLHVVVHGADWNAVPPIRWVADAFGVVRSAPRLDWDLVVESARMRRFVLASLAGLEYLARVFHARVPPEVLSALRALPVSHLEAEDQALRSRPPGLLGMARRVLLDYAFIVPRESTPFGGRVVGFLRFLRDRWCLDSFGQMPAYAVRSILRRARGR